jgi:photosystem II stability/assembly factor-like uncharacterized protein
MNGAEAELSERVSEKMNSICFIGLVAVTLGASVLAADFAIYRSTDDGHSWSVAGRGVPADLRTDALGESGPLRLAGTERGLFVSADDGQSWTRPARGVPESLKVCEFAVAGRLTYAATSGGVWASADHGRTWTMAGAKLAGIKVLSLTVAAGRVFAGTDLHGAWMADAPTNEWTEVGAGLPPRAQLFQLAAQDDTVIAALYSQGVYRFDAVAKRWNPLAEEWPLRLTVAGEIVFSGRNPGGVFLSRDGGASWRDGSAGLPENAPTWCLASRGDTVLIGTRGDSRLLRYEPAVEKWQPSDQGLPRGASPIALGLGANSVLAAVIMDGPRAP